MGNFNRRCTGCGTPYSAWDAYCSVCGAKLVQQPPDEAELLEGIPLSDWHVFIDKNASRYMALFVKHKEKKVFFHMNWAAMFFNVYWMFYRRMYKYALLFLAVSLVFSLAVTAGAVLAFKPEFEVAQSIIAPYEPYLGDYDWSYATHGSFELMAEVRETVGEYNAAVNLVTGKLTFFVVVATLLFHTLFGLLADCLYRAYVRAHIRYTNGGTSGWSLAGGVALYLVFSRLIESPLIQLVTAKLLE